MRLTKAELLEIERKGGKVTPTKKVKKKRVVKAQPSPDIKPEPKVIQAQTVLEVPAVITDNMQRQAELLDSLVKKVEGIGDRRPSPYRFTVNRDRFGNMKSVDAVPVDS